MTNLEFQLIDTHSMAYPAVLALRNQVLRAPLGLSIYEEDLSGDASDYIITAYHEQHLIGCVMLHPLPDGEIKLRQMAVHPSMQGKGVGRAIVQEAERIARERGFHTITMHARETAIGFYHGLGYTLSGNRFTEVTIPHFKMQKTIR